MVKNLPAMQRPGLDPWVGKIPWRKEWQATLAFLPGESPGQRSLMGARNAGDPCSILGLRISPGVGNGYPLQYSCLKNSMDRGAWWIILHGVTKSQI